MSHYAYNQAWPRTVRPLGVRPQELVSSHNPVGVGTDYSSLTQGSCNPFGIDSTRWPTSKHRATSPFHPLSFILHPFILPPPKTPQFRSPKSAKTPAKPHSVNPRKPRIFFATPRPFRASFLDLQSSILHLRSPLIQDKFKIGIAASTGM